MLAVGQYRGSRVQLRIFGIGYVLLLLYVPDLLAVRDIDSSAAAHGKHFLGVALERRQPIKPSRLTFRSGSSLLETISLLHSRSTLL